MKVRGVPAIRRVAKRNIESTISRIDRRFPRGFARRFFWLSGARNVSTLVISALFISVLLIISVVLSGCGKTTARKSQLRTVTDEIVAAAQNTTGRKSEITVHRGGAGKPDTIYLSASDPSERLALQRSLAEIAQRHKLSIVEVSSGGVDRFDLALNGVRTHTVRVVAPLMITRSRVPAAASPGPGKSKLAIIIDDLGADRAAADAVVALPFRVTVSVLPHQAFSAEIAEEAYRRGDQVFLHLPMEAQSSVHGEPGELRVGMNPQEVQSALSGMLDTVPHAVGVNNHEGSRATSNPALMAALMPALRDRHLFFVDSRTSPSTVAYDTAHREGLAASSRKVFLDDTPTRDAVLAQLQVAARDATRDGSAIAIGHPHPATIAALAEAASSLEAQGIRLVFASDVVR